MKNTPTPSKTARAEVLTKPSKSPIALPDSLKNGQSAEKNGKYDKEAIINKIVAGLSDGRTLREMCREEGMPSFVAVYDWIKADEDVALRIACAREAGYDCIADQIIEIVDDASNDTVMNEDGTERTNGEVVARSRLRAEMRLKLLSKWSPKKYGDKLAVGGADDLPAIKIERIERVIVAVKKA